LHGGEWIGLHQGNVLVGGRMQNQVRAVFLEEGVNQAEVAYVARYQPKW
jgi:hypothetical protein